MASLKLRRPDKRRSVFTNCGKAQAGRSLPVEDFGSIEEAPDDLCRTKVGECGLFVCIAGPLYGSRNPAGSSLTSGAITMWSAAVVVRLITN